MGLIIPSFNDSAEIPRFEDEDSKNWNLYEPGVPNESEDKRTVGDWHTRYDVPRDKPIAATSDTTNGTVRYTTSIL